MDRDEELQNRWELGDRKVFLYVGTHAIYHGLETIIHCAALLQERRDIVFLLVGDGPERDTVKELARSIV